MSSKVQGSPISTEFLHTFINPSNDRKFAVKNLYGDSGADHKAEEMAGRLFLIDYYIQDDLISRNAVSTGWDFIFVPEGYWSMSQIELLVSAGWKVADPKQLGGCLGEFVGKPIVNRSARGKARSTATPSA